MLILGLDVLGNPLGIIRGLAEGVESLFYEPYKVCLAFIVILVEICSSLIRAQSKVRLSLLKV